MSADNDRRYLSAREAAEQLGVRVDTIYAYVSRGLLHSEAHPAGGKRRRRYLRADVDALRRRRAQRQQPARSAAEALAFGDPVLDSAITLIQDGQLFYRGQNALALAEQATFEQVAGLIWTGVATGGWYREGLALPEEVARLLPFMAALPLMARFQALLPVAAANDWAAYDFRPVGIADSGRRLLQLLVGITAGGNPSGPSVSHALADCWLPAQPGARRLLEQVLILCADHELNPSSFTARVVAGAGATPYGVVQAGLASLQGTRHGGFTARVTALLREVRIVGDVRAALTGRLARGDDLPGFGHPLYPDGDPRARFLLEAVTRVAEDERVVQLAAEIAAGVYALIGRRPTLDFALVTVAEALGLPDGSALTLFALGRTVGWIGHAQEQVASAQLIRPRARYTGPSVAGD